MHKKPRKLRKNSNVVKTFQLVKPGIPKFYIVGVFDKIWKVYGLDAGVGTRRRVMEAYEFLGRNYREGDSICLFGFSRGSAACRILSNVIYTAGIPDMTKMKGKSRKKISKEIYKCYRGKRKDKKTAGDRKLRAANFIVSWNKRHKKDSIILRRDSINIEVMGLWDTVDDLGKSDFCEADFCSPDTFHLYQICNIKRAFHALALDDNRAQLYTPILLTGPKITRDCSGKDVTATVEEAWFSGAHSDVGGGWKESLIIRNTSLKWMFSKLKRYNLLAYNYQKDTIKTDNLAPISNMQEKVGFRISTKDLNRSIRLYLDSTKLIYNGGKINVHHSVLERLADGKHLPTFKLSERYRWDWYDQYPFYECFKRTTDKDGTVHRTFIDSCNCIKRIDDK